MCGGILNEGEIADKIIMAAVEWQTIVSLSVNSNSWSCKMPDTPAGFLPLQVISQEAGVVNPFFIFRSREVLRI